MKALIFVVLVILSTVKSEQHDSHDDHRHKKEQLGFFGSRGRRSVENDVDPTTIITTTEVDNNDGSQENIRQLSSLGDVFSKLQYSRSIRTPKGFFGTRGKKDYAMEAEKRALLQQNYNNLLQRSRFIEPTLEELNGGYPSFITQPKRSPGQAFFGMRGKKFGDYDMSFNNMMNEKRAPAGFVGMRGKKSNLDMFDENEIDDPQVFDYNYHDKRTPSGFLGVRGKKMYDFMYR